MLFGRQSLWKQAVLKLYSCSGSPRVTPLRVLSHGQDTELRAWAQAVEDCSDIGQIPASTDIPDDVEFAVLDSYILRRTHC